MNVGCWNVRGVNQTFKQQEIRNFITRNMISLLGIQETRASASSSGPIIQHLMRGWRYLTNYASHPNRRIWVIWDPNVLDVSQIFVDAQVIHVHSTIIQRQITFQATFAYGLNSYMERRKLWDCLEAISISLTSDPWTVLGDFNAVRFPGEMLGGNLSWAPYMDELNDCCLRTGLEDLRFSGSFLTWSKGEGESFKARKLDRVLINQEWASSFPSAEAIFQT